MTDDITNNDDLIDSRDVIKRIEELEDDRQRLEDDIEDAREQFASWVEASEVLKSLNPERYAEQKEEMLGVISDAKLALEQWEADEDAQELKALKALAEEAEGYAPDWTYGATLIRDSYFEDYARELADDIGAVPKEYSWPANCIDWKEAAEQLQMDYTRVDFDGVDYWVRS
jgi:hypothetical protein